MCSSTSQFILCTCADKKKNSSKNSWSLYKYHEGKNYVIFGIWTGLLVDDDYEQVYGYLLHELNNRNCFDKEFTILKHDRLAIHLGSSDYGFAYDGSKWEPHPYDPFSWDYEHDHSTSGCVENLPEQQVMKQGNPVSMRTLYKRPIRRIK